MLLGVTLVDQGTLIYFFPAATFTFCIGLGRH